MQPRSSFAPLRYFTSQVTKRGDSVMGSSFGREVVEVAGVSAMLGARELLLEPTGVEEPELWGEVFSCGPVQQAF